MALILRGMMAKSGAAFLVSAGQNERIRKGAVIDSESNNDVGDNLKFKI
jgi:hypothetical protein